MAEQPPATIEEARRLLDQGDAAGAIRVLQQLLRGMPDSFPARIKLAEAYRIKSLENDPMARSMALREFERALRMVPEEERAHAALGDLAVQLGQAARLRQEYEGRFKGLPFAGQCAAGLKERESTRAGAPGRRGPPKGLVWVVLLVAAAALGLWFFKRGQPVFSQPAPAAGFVLRDLAGDSVSLSDFSGKKVVILDFWATWCPPCRASLPALAKFRNRYAARGVEVLSVNLEESPQRVRDFISSQGLALRVLLDSDGNMARSYRVQGIPTVLVLDKQGRERERIVGFRPDLETRLAETVEGLL